MANRYFSRVETLLRKSLGVSESAKVSKLDVRPAPPIAERVRSESTSSSDYEEPISEHLSDNYDDDDDDEDEKPKWEDWSSLKHKLPKKVPASDDDGINTGHDEL